jgi:hypothetical protein
MDTAFEVVIFFTFFAPVALLVALNLMFHSMALDVIGPWLRSPSPVQPEAPAASEALAAPEASPQPMAAREKELEREAA